MWTFPTTLRHQALIYLRGIGRLYPRLMTEAQPTDPAVAVPPVIQCLDDSIRWFGEAEVWSYQVTGYDLPLRGGRSAGAALCSVGSITPVEARRHFRHRHYGVLAGRRSPWSRMSSISSGGAGHVFFTIGPLVDAPAEVAAGLDWKWHSRVELASKWALRCHCRSGRPPRSVG